MATELLTFIIDGNVILLIVVIAVLFSVATVILMINDYRLYLEEEWNNDFGFFDFLKRERFFIYLLLFFLLVVVIELWVHGLLFM